MECLKKPNIMRMTVRKFFLNCDKTLEKFFINFQDITVYGKISRTRGNTS